MFAGHIGAALALGRAERRINCGWMVFAALLLDVALWSFVLIGVESVAVPASFATTHQAEFVFPYSHGLLASLAWSALAGGATFLGYPGLKSRRLRPACFVALAVFSHWLLDALVHVPELPLAGESSMKVGLGMWNWMPVALALEACLTVAGLWVFLAGARLSRARKRWLVALVLSLLAFTLLGMTAAPAPPSAAAMAASSLVAIALACLLAGWLGNERHRTQA